MPALELDVETRSPYFMLTDNATSESSDNLVSEFIHDFISLESASKM